MALLATQAIAAYTANHNMAATAISDTAANLIANLTGLQTLQRASKITAVTLLPGAYNISAANAAALAALPTFSRGTATLTIGDSATALLSSANAAGLAAASAVQLTGNNTATASMATTLATKAGFTVAAGASLVVADTATNLLAAGNATGLAKATAVQLTGTNTATAATATSLAAKIGFSIAVGATLVVADSAANLLLTANTAGLGKATSVQLTGSNTVGASQATQLVARPGLTLATGATLVVADTALNLLASANATGLARATSTSLTGANTVTAAVAASLVRSTAFAVSGTMVVADTAANLLAATASAGLARATSVQLIGTNVVTVANARTLLALTAFSVASGAKITVADSAATLLAGTSAAAVALATAIQLTGANLSTAANATLLAGKPSFALATGATLVVQDSTTNLLVPANAAGLAKATAIQISGSNTTSASNATALAALSGLSLAAGASLVVSDSTTNLLDTTYAAGLAKATALQINASVTVTTAKATALSKLRTLSLGTSVTLTVNDTPSNISAAIDTLQTLAAAKLLSAITLTASGPLSITATQLTADSAALAKLPSNYTLNVTSVLLSAAAAVRANTHVVSFNLADTAANILTASNAAAVAAAASVKLTGTNTLTAAQARSLSALAGITIGNGTIVQVIDTYANIGGAIDALQTLANSAVPGSTYALKPSDSGALTITYGQLTSAASLLAALPAAYRLIVTGVPVAGVTAAGTNTHISGFTVSDTASAITAGLDALNGAAKLTAIAITDATPVTLSITGTQFAADTQALSLITTAFALDVTDATAAAAAALQAASTVSSFTVLDTGANIAAHFDDLATDTKLTAIALSGTAPTVLPVTYLQLTGAADASVRTALTGTFSYTVSGVAPADIAAVEATTGVTSLTVTGATAAQATTLQADAKVTGFTVTGALVSDISSLTATGSKVTGIGIADTGANIAPALAALNTNSTVTAIAVTDQALSLTYAAYTAAASALGKLTGICTLAISAVPVSAIAALQADARVTSLSLLDTAAHINAAFDSLNSNTLLGTITVSDGGTLNLTAAGFASDTVALAALTGSYAISVTGVAAADVATVEANSHVTSLTVPNAPATQAAALISDSKVTALSISNASAAALVSLLPADPKITGITIADSAAHIGAICDLLDTSSLVRTITVTDGLTTPIPLTWTQYTSDTTLAARLVAPFSFAISGAPVSAITTLNSDSRVVSFAISDTAIHIAAALDALDASSKLTDVQFSDAVPATLSLTDTQLTTDTSVLGKLAAGTYAFAVSQVAAARAAAVQSNALVAHFAVTDTAAAIAAAFDALASDTKLTVIAVTDGATATLPITYTQLISDTATLSALTGAYALDVSGVPAQARSQVQAMPHVATIGLTGVSVSDANSVQADPTVSGFTVIGASVADLARLLPADTKITGIAILDRAAALLPAMPALNTNPRITAIAFSDQSPVITYAQYTAWAATLGKMSGGYGLVVIGAPVMAATALHADSHVAGFSITDTTPAVIAALASLTAETKLGSITLTDQAAVPLSLTFTQFTANSTALAALGNASFIVTDVPAAYAGSIQANPRVTGFAVTDSASNGGNAGNVAIYFDILNADTKLTGITLTGAGVPTMPLTYAQFHRDTFALSRLPANYYLTISDAPANITAAGVLQSNSHVTGFSVSDSAANIAAAFDALNGYAKTSAITLTDAATAPLAISYAHLNSDTTSLALLTGTLHLAVAAVPYAAYSTIETWQSTANHTIDVTSLTVIDVPLISVATMALDTLVTSFTVAGATIASLPDIETYPAITGIGLTDSADAILNDLDALGFDGRIRSIAFTDAVAPQLNISYGQYVGDFTALASLTGAYTLVVRDATAAAAAVLQGDSHVAAFSVADTAAGINAAIDLLHAAPKLTAIAYTDSTAPTLSITYAQYVNDLTGATSIAALLPAGTTFNILATPASATIGITLQNDPLVATFSVTDTAANVNAAAAALALDRKWIGVELQSPPPPATIVVNGTTGADIVDFTGTSVPLAIDLKHNTAFVSAGLAAPTIAFIGAPDSITLGTGTATISYLLAPTSGIETIANFQYGLDLLAIDMNGVSPLTIRATDTTIAGVHAISFYNQADPGHGILLTGMPSSLTASDLLANHLTIGATTATIF